MIQIDSKFPQAGTTIFTVMSELAERLQALNLSQGFPDFAPPKALLDAFHQVSDFAHQYPAGHGILALRQLISEQYQQQHQIHFDPVNEVTITAGATIAIYSAIQALIHPQDEVIVFDPAYDSYAPAIHLAGGKTVHIALQAPDFQVDWNQVHAAITSRTRMIIVNTPHNPTGSIWCKEDWLNLIQLIENKNIIVLSDEVYEHLVFDGQRHYSVMDFPELQDRALAIGSFGKSFHVTGWRTGYCVAKAALMRELRQVYQFANFCGVQPCQIALAQFMQQSPEHLKTLANFYQQKRDFFLEGIQHSRFSAQPSQGTYFQLLDYSAIRDDLNDVEMCQWLAEQHRIVSIPISVFYQQPPQHLPYLRFCFAKKTETLQQALDILSNC
ncbi:aminotransferase class I/II-fold pyridoxal phosphate-dependent enzyme [Acinetobacter qingfengensis]|uniref:Aminotransferase n=1 Tax=Acinetobacter qingfengensis TaxID=1262585 RepID=A0A1E7R524_9GAMM|nr:methionine aminotransferase [Acinetobacter qingfengensis]KAA8732390.1 aminotransferase class I/II-fold pyridoxal phosphate-dependent enzyme [Acinetobacter qingfengensis]OEY94385.1 aminotransferase [Acinetobacter qingfengensis]